MTANPLQPFLDAKGYVLLDGGLSTELELQGHDLRHRLWTARLLDEDPDALLRAHRAFLDAGADCVLSASYQATPQGLVESGFTPERADDLILASHEIAERACDEAYAARGGDAAGPRPIAAGSIGPYGAYLADGSEYTGDYGLSVEELVDFHMERIVVLSTTAPLLAIETIPSIVEARALRVLLAEILETPAWVSFSCRDGEHIADGSRIEDAAALFDELPNVIAVGVNCTDPAHVASLIDRLRARATGKEIVVYPNSGETYCADDKSWGAAPSDARIEHLAASWRGQGARIVGGCCRISAETLGRISSALGG